MTETIKLPAKKGRLISLDGDMNHRSYRYLNQFGKSINIRNTIKFIGKNMTVNDDEELFLEPSINSLYNNDKTVVPCMSMSYATNLESKLRECFNDSGR